MSKGRRRGREPIDLFDSGARVSLEDTDAAIFGQIADVDLLRQVAKPISIFEIYPDPTQPRRAVPSEVRAHWTGAPQTVAALFDAWVNAVQREKDAAFDLQAHLLEDYLPPGADGNDDDNIPRALRQRQPLETALLDIVALAVSIRKVGLTNPITVARDGGVYRLETGERRWLAFHLLHLNFPAEDWSRIPARVVDQVSVWRQASENNARANLNAISKARQFAILLMDLLQEQRGVQFTPFHEVLRAGRSEREYYAQVADGDQFRIPRGQGEKLLNAMGLKNPVQLRQYRALLKLPDEVWRYADDHNLTEWEIRKLEAATVTAVTVAPDDKQPDSYYNPFVERANKQRRARVWAYASRLPSLSAKEREQALREIEAEERWLAELKRAIQGC
ncbi:MAG: ParB/RepB/Spo0J family partition protein [Aggregatilineales bacterium]